LQIYSLLARIEDDPDRALRHVEEGRTLAEKAGQSSASWDLMELSIRYARHEPAEIERLLRHLNTQHIREPGVAAALHDWLVQIGAIPPEGVPAAAGRPPQAPDVGAAAPAQPAAEPGKLWTPGGQQPAGEKPKLWMPGMD
jgi:cell division septation protein DedD